MNQKFETPPVNRDKIREAATRLFLVGSFHAVTVKQIAVAAGVPIGSLHKAIGGKSELVFQLLVDFEEGLFDAVKKRLPPSPDCYVVIEAFVQGYIEYAASNRDVHLLARRELHCLSADHQRGLRSIKDKLLNRLWQIVALGQATGVFSAQDLRMTAKIILATLEGTVANRTLTVHQLRDAIPLLKRMAVHYLAAGRR